MTTVTFRLAPENQWVDDIPATERDYRINLLLGFANYAQLAVATPAVELGTEHRAAFQRVYDMLQLAIPRAIQTAHNSSIKGTAAETSMDDCIATHFPTLALRDTSGIPHAGDRHLVGDDYTIMIEYKDYVNPVPTKEVQKFQQDACGSGYQVAVMCSFETHICRKPQQRISFEQIGTSTLVYVPAAGRDGCRLLTVLAWAEWFCCYRKSHERRHAADHERAVATALEAIDVVDTLQRELQVASERMRKELDRVDTARLSHCTELKTRLSTIV